ncbi:hypothetical protein GCM10027084_28740 [Pseudoxanthomonas sangjuensis]|uniref:hypothetical protein n=1 Tax=Pseudoxanthomonas sangjuensis TaxID=1503750 RepID=UPI00139184C8|nr:hypothetical protein [Pseudoxanthomonas sangjuensis]
MSKAAHYLGIFVGGLIALVLFAAGTIAIVACNQDYSWAEMDWNSDGTTTPGEIFAASDIGKRPRNGCIEYFNLKDGLPVKSVCPDGTPNNSFKPTPLRGAA